MSLEYTETQLDAVIQTAVAKHGGGRDAVIPILSEINQTLGFIPTEAFGKIRRLINAPEEGLFLADSHLYAISSFYHMFSLKPTGEHVIRFCESAPCHVVGGNPAKTIKVRDREHYDLLKQRGRVYLGLKREGAMSPRLLE